MRGVSRGIMRGSSRGNIRRSWDQSQLVKKNIKRLIEILSKEIDLSPVNEMDIFVIEMQNIMRWIPKLRHTHCALLAKSNTVAKTVDLLI